VCVEQRTMFVKSANRRNLILAINPGVAFVVSTNTTTQKHVGVEKEVGAGMVRNKRGHDVLDGKKKRPVRCSGGVGTRGKCKR